MNTRIIPALLGALLFSGVAEAAPSIYPVDTARFLGGSRFDFKVEFDGELAEKDAKVLINGQDAKAVLGAKPEFIAKEKGADASALLLRGASLKPGPVSYTHLPARQTVRRAVHRKGMGHFSRGHAHFPHPGHRLRHPRTGTRTRRNGIPPLSGGR